jgi:hypothetical protein
MPEMDPITKYEKKLLRQITAQDRAVSAMFSEFSQATSPLLSRYNKPSTGIRDIWFRNKDIETALQGELYKLQNKLKDYMISQSTWAWNLSAEKTDLIVSDFIKNLSISDIAKDGLFSRHLDALKEFQTRKVAGMDLSQRTWNVCQQSKEQLEMYLESGLSTGRSAAEISRDVKKYLNNPDARFRRVRDPETGKLKPSKPMANYHPGQGTYRSAYKNALRMTRTETNMAYRMADHSRWQDLDFVTGFEVHLSSSHPAPDICDHMVGKYPKSFVFAGWHPNCYCYCTSILMTDDDFIEYLNTDKIPEQYKVSGIPPEAANYIKEKSATLAGYKNPPYWLRDNFKQRNGGFFPKQAVEKPPVISGAIKENPVEQPIKKAMVSDAFENISPKVETKVKSALNFIDSVHSDGVLPKIPIEAKGRMDAHGQFSTLGRYPMRISIKPGATNKEIVTIHEVGHFMDFSAIGAPGQFETIRGSLLEPVMNAINNSKAITKLTEQGETFRGYLTSGGAMAKESVKYIKYINYLKEKEELWARAYSQYIAEKTKNEILLTQVDYYRNLPINSQWDESDFIAIKNEIDKLFKELGWI